MAWLYNFFFLCNITERAYLQYSQIRPNLVDLEHTVVPEQHRGHGVAKVLAKVNSNSVVCLVLEKEYP